MGVSREQVIEWCTKLIQPADDFPSFEQCLDKLPGLDSLASLEAGTRVLVRGDTDVVVEENGTIEDDVRLRSLVETLQFGIGHGWVQIVYGHRGRDPKLSLSPVATHLQQLLKAAGSDVGEVVFIDEWLDDTTGEVLDSAAEKIASLPDGAVCVIENTRKYQMEQLLWKAKVDELDGLADRLTNYANSVREKLAAVHVNEGFAASNRDLSSTLVPLTMDHAVLGKYIEGELRDHVVRTRLAELVIFSGIKINKLDDLEQILNRGEVKMVIAAGSLAMALKKAAEPDFGLGLASDPDQKIFIPQDRIEQAQRMYATGQKAGVEFVLPVDFILSDGSVSESIPDGEAQFDVGPKTIELQKQKISELIERNKASMAAGNSAAVAFHNGVFGKFEEEAFSNGTREFIHQLKRANDEGVAVHVGGGEGGAALRIYGDESWVDHCYTAGGTLLKALGTLPIPYLKALYLKHS